eukprot:TRINITY_DN28025_c0_g1_i1.p1 TRINITY_DN28025_c0_g1~~TRINITY_DN28025_c0_g1_i1.p1  ORF type:complete len:185 (-),score=77.77 TRINITY_DN28025_c0_g1_i1:110-664(-)
MKPAWDKLMDEYKDHKTAVVADVDCANTNNDALCKMAKIEGFPTIKYGDPTAMQEYSGGRDFDSLQRFAQDNLGPLCGPEMLDLCTEKDKALVESFMSLSKDDLDGKIQAKEDALKTADDLFDEEVKKLNEAYQSLQKELSDKQSAINAAGFNMMKAIKVTKAKAKEKSSEKVEGKEAKADAEL